MHSVYGKIKITKLAWSPFTNTRSVEGRRPFGRWFDELNIEAAVKVETVTAKRRWKDFRNRRQKGAQ